MKKVWLAAGMAGAMLVVCGPANAESVPAAAGSTPAAASVAVTSGKQIYDGAGRRIGTIYRVTSDGNPQVILNGKLVTIPASTLSDQSGKIATSLSKADLERSK